MDINYAPPPLKKLMQEMWEEKQDRANRIVAAVEYPLANSISRKAGENNGENNDANKTILTAIRENVYITQPKLAQLSGFSLRKVNRIIAALRQAGKIKRIGKTKGGHWEIIG